MEATTTSVLTEPEQVSHTPDSNCSVCMEMNKVMIFRGTVTHDGTHEKKDENNARSS